VYGFRKLVDIAERSISQRFLDPTTAVEAIDRLQDCLRMLAPRPFPDGRHHDAGGELRFVERVTSWEGFVRTVFDELRIAGAATPSVARKLRWALEDLLAQVPAERRPPLERQLALLEQGVRSGMEEEEDASAALVGDVQGIGAGPDIVASDGREPAGARPG